VTIIVLCLMSSLEKREMCLLRKEKMMHIFGMKM